MRRRALLPVTSVLILLAGIASGAAQLDIADDFGLGSYGLRRLSAYYPRNFGSQIPAACYQSSYFSPYRIYFKALNLSASSKTTYIFQLDVSTCPVPKADCCRLWLDHMVVRTNSTKTVLGVHLDGLSKYFDMGPEGLTIYNMSVDPTALRSLKLEIVTPSAGNNYPGDLCSQSRFPGSCDVISYDASETCCTERSALPYEMFFPSPPSPTSDVGPGFNAPPPRPGSTPLTPSSSPQLPVSPPPPSPPPPPPPPPPDGWDLCCVDDVPQSPYILTYQGSRPTGSDTAYLFQVLVRNVPALADYDIDGPQYGDCSEMNLRDIGITIYGDLIVRNVLFNGTVMEYWMEPQATQRNASWLFIGIYRGLDTFNQEVLLDLVITVRGKVDSLCPANDILHSALACEWTMHGKDGLTHCCPHGITRRAGPYDDCCVDDMGKAPYRLDYLGADVSAIETVHEFGVQLISVTEWDLDGDETAACDHMSLDAAQIAIYKNVEVLQVKWADRVMSWNTTPATNFSNWLFVVGLNRFVNDFNTDYPLKLSVITRGGVRELCPAGWLLGSDGPMYCEYVLHGAQSNNTCCPHGVTRVKYGAKDVGCTDDMAGSPYRLGYQQIAVGNNLTMFYFDLAKDDPSDQFSSEVNCSSMSLRTLAFAVRANVEIQDVIFNGYNYTWQFEPYTNESKWLNILDIDYTAADLPLGTPVPLKVFVKGNTTRELCPTAPQSSSQSSCEYVIYGSAGADECCPKGVITWTTPSVLESFR